MKAAGKAESCCAYGWRIDGRTRFSGGRLGRRDDSTIKCAGVGHGEGATDIAPLLPSFRRVDEFRCALEGGELAVVEQSPSEVCAYSCCWSVEG